jgi:glyoxylase-like metal-dependent hydrolase (beta-lactamase superfamily II)
VRLERDTAPGIHRIEDGPVNWFLVEGDEGQGGLTVVDAGVPVSWDSLHRTLAQLRLRRGDLRALVLTHAHFDHVGFAERARVELGMPILVPRGDADIARHPLRYPHERSRLFYAVRPRPALMIGQLMVAGGGLRTPPLGGFATFGDGETLDVPGRPRVVATPGHSPGHCSLHLADRDTVIAGDAVVTLDIYTARRGPRLVARAATCDVTAALASLDAIAATDARTVLVGHGEPWRDGAVEAARLAREAGAA